MGDKIPLTFNLPSGYRFPTSLSGKWGGAISEFCILDVFSRALKSFSEVKHYFCVPILGVRYV